MKEIDMTQPPTERKEIRFEEMPAVKDLHSHMRSTFETIMARNPSAIIFMADCGGDLATAVAGPPLVLASLANAGRQSVNELLKRAMTPQAENG